MIDPNKKGKTLRFIIKKRLIKLNAYLHLNHQFFDNLYHCLLLIFKQRLRRLLNHKFYISVSNYLLKINQFGYFKLSKFLRAI